MCRGIRQLLGLHLCLRKYPVKGYHYSFNHPLCFTRFFSEWDIVGAVCLERKPIITQKLLPIEKEYLAYVQKLEFEKSHHSDHEVQHMEDLEIAEKLKKGIVDDIERTLKQTAQDFEETCQKELDSFTPSNRITEADVKNDQKSIQRKLDQSLFLVIKQKLGNDYQWTFPQTPHLDGETLRQTIERLVKSICGDNLKFQVLGNAPVGFYKYKYPKVVRENGACGAKVFFYKARLLKRNCYSIPIEQNNNFSDYLWLCAPELKKLFKPVYYKNIEPFLIIERNEDNGEVVDTIQAVN